MTSSGPVDMTSPSNADMAGSPSAGGDMLGPGNGASGCGCRVGGATGNADGGWIVCVLLAGFALMRRRLRISGEGVLKSPKSQECPNRVQNTGE
jgi:MYXO-CTERM domain-containing protein